MKRKQASRLYKAAIVCQFRNGAKPKDLAKQAGVNLTTIYRWRTEMEAEKKPGEEDLFKEVENPLLSMSPDAASKYKSINLPFNKHEFERLESLAATTNTSKSSFIRDAVNYYAQDIGKNLNRIILKLDFDAVCRIDRLSEKAGVKKHEFLRTVINEGIYRSGRSRKDIEDENERLKNLLINQMLKTD